jgi:hypothetical protein
MNDRKLIGKLKIYFESLTGQVATLHAAGKTIERIREEIVLDDSRELLAGDDPAALRFFDAVQDEAIERTYVELTGNE